MKQTSDELYLKLTQGPAFLLLGQDYLRLESGRDLFLSEVLRKYGKANTQSHDYKQIFEGEAQNLSEEALNWMRERYKRFSVPEWLKTVAMFAWNGVYASAIDDIWLEALNTEWRELQPVVNEKIKPTAARKNLHCTFLFGRLNWPDDDKTGQPPLSRSDYKRRKPVAVNLAARLPELITYFGVLVIEGYAGERDWLAPEDLFPIVDKLSTKQTHIFSVTDELVQNDDISYLVKSDKLVLHRENLASYLLKAETAGFIQLGQRPEEERSGRRIHIEGKILTIPKNIWSQVSKSAVILDDTILIPPPPISEAKRYSEFRDFLFNASIKPVWSGYERNFSFPRDFEKKLNEVVNKELESNEPSKKPIILQGQTATGKTIALGSLAYKIHKSRKRPVLFIEQRSQQSYVNYDIDEFFNWISNTYQGLPKTLVVWDGMLKVDEYYEILQFLDGRGHNNLVLVGSCYSPKRPKWLPIEYLIKSPARLGFSDKTEIRRFREFINKFDSYLGKKIAEENLEKEDYFLSLLYRVLPPTRSSIREGLTKELSNQIHQVRESLNKVPEESSISISPIVKAFLKAKLIPEQPVYLLESQEVFGEEMMQLDKIINLVMVAGQFNLKVPFELVMRAMGYEKLYNFASLFKEIDIIQWLEHPVTGNVAFSSRNAVEAKVLVSGRLGGVEYEIPYIKELIIEVRDSGDPANNPQIQFAIEIIQNISNEANRGRFYKSFSDITETLREREARDVPNPALMLQESRLLREFVVETDKREKNYPDNATQLLEKAESILRQSIDLLGSKQPRSTHYVELATVVARKAQLSFKISGNAPEAIQLFKESRELAIEALALDPENYYAAGTIGWATEYFLTSGILDLQSIGEACVDFRNAYTMAYENLNSDFEPEVLEGFRLKIANIVKDNTQIKQALENLRACNSSLGYYVQAFNLVEKLWPFNQKITSEADRSLCNEAVNYLEKHRQDIEKSRDTRALYLLLKLWWMWKTGLPMFGEARQTVNLSSDEWEYCNRLVMQLRSNPKLRDNPSLMYFNGLAIFHLGLEHDALKIFGELQFEADSINSSRRRIRYYLASSSDGKPKKYSGLVRGSERKRTVWVTEFQKEITFIPIEFFGGRTQDISPDKNLPEFHIAFSFLGPIVDRVKP
jgi:hypothetical protein